MPKILISDRIAEEGIDLLRTIAEVDIKVGLNTEELISIIGGYEGLVVRSQTQVTSQIIDAGGRLLVIARAGIGVDNIDLESATVKGIAVVNAPTGNVVAAAEHTIALLYALARNIPQAHMSLKSGSWDRNRYIGVELRNKTIGLIGLGRVGSQVARWAQALGLRVIGHDPFISPDLARILGIELQDLDALLNKSDFVSLHLPLSVDTKHFMNRSQFNLMKQDSYLINVARGELVDEAALLEYIDNGRLSGAALDVFSQEPPLENSIVSHPKVIVTPHLGASTQEAQIEGAIEVAEQVISILEGRPARNTVNMAFLAPEVHAVISPFVSVNSMIGKLLLHLANSQIIGVSIDYQGEISDYDTSSLNSALLVGLLSPVSGENVNLINAPLMAQRRGFKISESKGSGGGEYGNLITATLKTDSGDITISGTSLRNEVHIVRVNEYWLDMVPSVPYLLFVEHKDVPGSIGAVGTITGKHDINISFMEVGRLSVRGQAMMVLGIDDRIPESVLSEIRAIDNIDAVKIVKL